MSCRILRRDSVESLEISHAYEYASDHNRGTFLQAIYKKFLLNHHITEALKGFWPQIFFINSNL